jgi:hypothetical protein
MTVVESTFQHNYFVIKTINFAFIKVHFYENKICFCNKIVMLDCTFYCIDNTYYTYVIQVMYIEFYQIIYFISRHYIRPYNMYMLYFNLSRNC